MPWQCVPDRVYPVSGYGPPKNINQAAYQNRSNNNPETTGPPPPSTFKPPVPQMDANRNSATAVEDSKTTTQVGGQTIKSSKSFESGVLGQHANTPNGIIPWPGDRKSRYSQWDHHHNNTGPYNGSSPVYNGSSPVYNGSSPVYGGSSPVYNGPSSPYNGPSSSYNGHTSGGETFLGNRSSGTRSSSRGPTYFSPQHNHVSTPRKLWNTFSTNDFLITFMVWPTTFLHHGNTLRK